MESFMAREWIKAIVILGLAAVVGAGAREARAAFGDNLVVNGDAEAGKLIATIGGFGTYSTPGWTNIAGNFEAEAYADGTPPNNTPTSPGPANRGALLFYGGIAQLTVATQSIDISASASMIDMGIVRADVVGYLGGFVRDNDNAIFSATFLGANNNFLGSVSIGPVLAADRGNVSALLFEAASAFLPMGTRSIQATLTFTRTNGSFNNGAADNLSITLAAVPEPSSLILAGIPAALGLVQLARRRLAGR